MTPAQFENYGIELDTWINLDSICDGFLFSNEGTLFATPKTMEAYFDSSNNLVWIRYMDGRLSTNAEKYKNSSDYVVTSHNGTDYYTRLVPGGLTDKSVGRYHTVYDMDKIIMIH